MATRYLSTAEVGALFGVSASAVSNWRKRFDDCPEPDVMVGAVAGWSPESESEWRRWHAARPGQGVGGGRPRRVN